MFQSLVPSFLKKGRKSEGRRSEERELEGLDNRSIGEGSVLEGSVIEGSVAESEISEDTEMFARSTFRQSVRRAIGFRKSLRKAVNKKKKENIQNIKLLTGGEKSRRSKDGKDSDAEYYEDTELDCVVVRDAPSSPATCPSSPQPRPTAPSRSRIPKRRQSTRGRPTVSVTSSSLFAQSVSTKKSAGEGVQARKNKASELREEAIKKKLDNSPGLESSLPVPAAPARRKLRSSLRTKKGIARRPIHKKDIRPAENKASQLRARKHQEEGEPGSANTTIPSTSPPQTSSTNLTTSSAPAPDMTAGPTAPSNERYSSQGIKTSAPDQGQDRMKTPGQNQGPQRPGSLSYEPRRGSIDIPAARVAPRKPARTKPPPPTDLTPRTPVQHTDTSHVQPQQYTARKAAHVSSAEKVVLRSERTNIPRPITPSTPDPSKDLVFVSLESTSLPLPGATRPHIDDIGRKRKIKRPVSNIFEGGAGELTPGKLSQGNLEGSGDAAENKFAIHVNKTQARTPQSSKAVRNIKSPSSAFSASDPIQIPRCPTSPSSQSLSSPKSPIHAGIPRSFTSDSIKNYRTPLADCKRTSRIPSSEKPPKHSERTKFSSTEKPSKPSERSKTVQVQNKSNFTRQNSIGSSRRSRKGNPAISNSETSDIESLSYGSCLSFDEDDLQLASPPVRCDSPRFRGLHYRTPANNSSLISTDDLENQKHNLRTPCKRSGSIRVRNIKARRSWATSDIAILDLEQRFEKEQIRHLSEEALILEDLTSGYDDIVQTLASRTHVLKNVVACLRRGDSERSARMAIALCFPRSTQHDTEFQTLRRACTCNTDDLALFQNCLALILRDRDQVTLPVISLLLGRVRLALENLGSDVLRGPVGDILKFVTGSLGHVIMGSVETDGYSGRDYRLQEAAEVCRRELIGISTHVRKLLTVDYSIEVASLNRTLEMLVLG